MTIPNPKKAMTSRMNENLFKVVFVVVMFMALLCQSFFSSACAIRENAFIDTHYTTLNNSQTQIPPVR